MGNLLCGFQQNDALKTFCQHTKQQKIKKILCKWSLTENLFYYHIYTHCSNAPGHTIKIAAMPYDKKKTKNKKTTTTKKTKKQNKKKKNTLLKSSFWPVSLKRDLQHRAIKYYQVCSNMTLCWHLTFLRKGQVCPLCICMWRLPRNYWSLWCKIWYIYTV